MRSIANAVLGEIDALRQGKPHLLAAIDGRSAAGKTTLAALLQESCGCNVVHMDSFFLRPEQRTARRLSEPGGNVDRERFREEVLGPLTGGQPFSYRPFDCKRQEFAPAVHVAPGPITVVEGAYSCHPQLFESYDLTIFLSVGPDEQARRIAARNGQEGATLFAERWIPMEERYFAACRTAERCSLCFDTGDLL